MLQFSDRGKYSARPGALKAIIQSLAAQFSVLPDTRMLWIASDDPVLDLPTLCDQIQVFSQTQSSDRANSYFGLPADVSDMPLDPHDRRETSRVASPGHSRVLKATSKMPARRI